MISFRMPFAGIYSKSFFSVSTKRRRKQDQCCSHLNSLSSIKYAIVFLYILVLLTIFGLCLAGKVCVSVDDFDNHKMFLISTGDLGGFGGMNVILELSHKL